MVGHAIIRLGERRLHSVDAPSEGAAFVYDPLNRLTAAAYSDGTYFHYTYDAVGNMTMQVACIGSGCTPVTTNYVYDIANRLISVDGVPYSWDDNGNLLSDGIHTYTYDHANRLVGVSGPTGVTSYAYNGLSDCMQQTTGGNTTNYLLDISAGLSQVLDDGSNTYLNGMGRIAQYDAAGT